MSSFTISTGRVLLIAGVLAIALAACGRRGPPEAPPDASVPQQGVSRTAAGPGPTGADDIDEEDAVVTTPVPAPRPARNAKRGYTVPKDPFVLDPLL
jgi:predicted small lipoprotein YifL